MQMADFNEEGSCVLPAVKQSRASPTALSSNMSGKPEGFSPRSWHHRLSKPSLTPDKPSTPDQ